VVEAAADEAAAEAADEAAEEATAKVEEATATVDPAVVPVRGRPTQLVLDPAMTGMGEEYWTFPCWSETRMVTDWPAAVGRRERGEKESSGVSTFIVPIYQPA